MDTFTTDTAKTRENMSEKSKISKTDDKRTYVIAQEIKLAKILAGNNKTLRDRALKRLKRWFLFRSQTTSFTENDFMRIWKGLFYAMWMSDKPVFQEECAEMIASLIHLKTVNYSLMFFKCGLQTLGNEWFGIDQLRLDKFLMFVRRLLRQGFVILKNNSWNLKVIKEFNNVLSATILSTENLPPIGLSMYFTEIYLEELAKVSEGKIRPNLMTEFVNPFVKQLALLKDSRQITCIIKNIFRYLIRQSDIGMGYDEKFKAWRDAGFPGGSINSMQKQKLSDDELMSDDENENLDQKQLGEKALDPRAGHVDVILPQLKFVPKQIVEILTENRFLEGSNSKSRKAISTVIDEFSKLSKGHYPLGIKRIDIPKKDGYSTKTKNAVNRLVKFENKLLNRKKKRKNQTNDNNSEEAPVKQQKTSVESKKKKLDKKLEEFIKKSESDLKLNGKKEKKTKKLINDKKNKSETKKNKADKEESNLEVKRKKKLDSLADLLYNNMNTKLRKKAKKDEINNENKKLRKKLLRTARNRDVKKKIIADDALKQFECAFERNSGTWYVFDDGTSSNSSSQSDSILEPSTTSPFKEDITKQNDPEILPSSSPKITDNKDVNDIVSTPESLKPSTSYNLTKNSMPEPSKIVLFQQDEWDVPLKEGEIDFFVESKKFKSIMARRRSLDSQTVKNPFAKAANTPGSAKKVKIDLKLNKAQDIHEHVAQIKSSPGIPYDADRRPLKPLLKRRSVL